MTRGTRVKKRRIWLVVLIVLVLLAVAAVWFFCDTVTDTLMIDTPSQITVTVAWNPHSTADDMIRAMAGGMDTQLTLQNIPGANGANGANSVWGAEHDGESLLSTSLSALVTSEAMGFADSSFRDWAVWLSAFSPAMVVVAADSPYHTMDDLIAALRQNPDSYRCANPGFGSVGFAAAQLLKTRLSFEFEITSNTGNNTVSKSLFDGEADFAVLLSIDAASYLRSGELRALGAFGETGTVPSVAGLGDKLDAILPFGEYYGLFAPSDTSENRLRGLDSIISAAITSEAFTVFLHDRELVPAAPDRKQGGETSEHIASLLCWTLYDAGYLPTGPDTLGIGKSTD